MSSIGRRKSALLKMGSTLGIAVFGVATALLVSANLSEREFARYALLTSALSFWLVIADMGTGLAFIRAYVGTDLASEIRVAAISLRLVTGAIGATLAALLLGPLLQFSNAPRAGVSVALLLAVAVLGRAAFLILLADLQARNQWKREATINLGSNAAVFVALLATVLLFDDVTGEKVFAVLAIVWGAAGLVWSAGALAKQEFEIRQVARHGKELLRFGRPLGVAGVCYYFVALGDTFVLSRYTDEATVSAYFLALSAFSVLRQAIGGLEVWMFPELAAWGKLDDRLGTPEWRVGGLVRGFALSGFALGAGVSLAPIARNLGLAGANQVGSIMADMFPLFVIRAGSIPLTSYAIAVLGETRAVCNVQITAAIVSVVGNFLLIPLVGYRGAILSSFVAYLFTYLFLLRLPGLKINAWAVRGIVAAVASALAVNVVMARTALGGVIVAALLATAVSLYLWRTSERHASVFSGRV